MKWLKLSGVVGFSLFAKHCFAQPAEFEHYQLLLAGGALKTCSTLSSSNCRDLTKALKQHQLSINQFKTEEIYRLSELQLDQLRRSDYWQSDDPELGEKLFALLSQIKRQHGSIMSNDEFVEAFKVTEVRWGQSDFASKLNGKSLYKTLSDHNWYLMLDYLQHRQSYQQQRKTEQVILSDSKHAATIQIFTSFVKLADRVRKKKLSASASVDSSLTAQKSKPLIVFLTSSSRDPFDAVDFYLQVLSQAGADAKWLPIDPAVLYSIEHQQCKQLHHNRARILGTVRREEIYPELDQYQQNLCNNPEVLLNLVKKADGLFINGGDQSLSLKALRRWDSSEDSSLLKLIRTKVKADDLIVGGTSAGAAVQSGGELFGQLQPMITNGDSYQALKRGTFDSKPPKVGCDKDNSCGGLEANDVTYRSSGGLGLIAAGIIDTHFSERGRQGRLIQLALDTSSPFAFGVDETSALLVGENEQSLFYKSIGENGVWMFDLRKAHITKQNEKKQVRGVIAHYLSHDDRMVIDKATGETEVLLAKEKHPFAKAQSKLIEQDILYRDRFRALANALALSKRTQAIGWSHQDIPRFRFKLIKTEGYSSGLAFYQMYHQQSAHVSFKNLRIEIDQVGQ